MRSAGPSRIFSEKPAHVHADNAFSVLTDYFIPMLDELQIGYGESAVLARTWFTLRPLGQQLRRYGIPVVGPGARPYRRSHLFARLAEQLCAYVEDPTPHRAPNVEREIFRLIMDVTGQANYSVFTYDGRRIAFRLLGIARELRQQHEGAIPWLTAAARDCAQALCDAEFLPLTAIDLMSQSVDDMQTDIIRNREDVANMTVADLGLFASPANSMKLLTMHGAKGREFDAVAIVDMHAGRVPSWRADTAALLEEEKRLLYVAITRARRLLVCATDSGRWNNSPSPFLYSDGLGLLE